MWSTAREIANGDLVIIWMTRDLIQPLVIEAGKELNMRFGVYRHSDLIGIPYGSKVGSRNGKGFIHVLRPTPELWTLALPHRTQILYIADISFVTNWLDIKPGSKVIEAGTGSGSFTHSTARTVGPTGHLWSYEFHEARFHKAQEEFARHGMDDIVTLTHRNVCKDGFTVIDEVDAVFLDLPAPWEAVPHAKVALRSDRTTRICCFSPCMEQVMRTVRALNESGFTEITMYETLMHPHQVDAIPELPSIDGISDQLKRAEVRREEKRLKQIAQAQRAAKRKRGEAVDEGDNNGGVGSAGQDGSQSAGKRAKTEESEREDAGDAQMLSGSATPNAGTSIAAVVSTPIAATRRQETAAHNTEEEVVAGSISVSKVFPEVRGHTSYLTFAVLAPASVRGLAVAGREGGASGSATPSVSTPIVGTPKAEVTAEAPTPTPNNQ